MKILKTKAVKSKFIAAKAWMAEGIRRKLMLTYVAVIVIPLILTSVTMYHGAVNIVTRQTEKYNYKMLQLMNEKIDNFIFQLDRVSYFVYLNDVQHLLNNMPSEPASNVLWQIELKNKINAWIGFLGFKGGLRGITMIDNDGGVYFNTGINKLKREYDFKNTNWYREALDSSGMKVMIGPKELNEYVVFDVYREGSLNFGIARKVYNLMGTKPLGVLVIEVEMYDVDNMLYELGIRDSTGLIIADRYENIIYRLGVDGDDSTISFLPYSNVDNGQIHTVNRRKVLINVFKSSYTNWSFITLTDAEILTSSAKRLNGLITLIGLLGFIIAMFISLLFSKKIVVPIKCLQESMRNVEKGDFTSNIPVTSQDEVGRLTGTFNSMVTRIRELINTVYKVEIKEKEANLNALQAQINPHYRFFILIIMLMLLCKFTGIC